MKENLTDSLSPDYSSPFAKVNSSNLSTLIMSKRAGRPDCTISNMFFCSIALPRPERKREKERSLVKKVTCLKIIK